MSLRDCLPFCDAVLILIVSYLVPFYPLNAQTDATYLRLSMKAFGLIAMDTLGISMRFDST